MRVIERVLCRCCRERACLLPRLLPLLRCWSYFVIISMVTLDDARFIFIDTPLTLMLISFRAAADAAITRSARLAAAVSLTPSATTLLFSPPLLRDMRRLLMAAMPPLLMMLLLILFAAAAAAAICHTDLL